MEQNKPYQAVAKHRAQTNPSGSCPPAKLLDEEATMGLSCCMPDTVRRAWTQVLCPNSLMVPTVPSRFLLPGT